MDSASKVKYLFKNNEFMVVATAGQTGKPWISPVGFMYDDEYNLYWVSNKDATHSKNVRNRPEIAIVIFGKLPGGDMDGVYVDAKAVELKNGDEIEAAIKILAKRRQPAKFTTKSKLDVSGDALWRIYKAVPVEISKRGDKVVHGQAITVREPIKF